MLKAITLTLCMLLVLSASAGFAAENQPAKVVEHSFEVFLLQAQTPLDDIICRAELEQSKKNVAMMQQIQAAGALVEFEDTSFTEERRTDTEAIVHVRGNQLLYAVKGMEPSVHEVDVRVQVIHEDGAWKACSGINK